MFYYLSLSAALLSIGVYGVFARKTLIGKLIALYAILNAAVVNLAAFNKFIQGNGSTGLVFIALIVIVSFAEILLGLLIIYQFYSQNRDADDDTVNLTS